MSYKLIKSKAPFLLTSIIRKLSVVSLIALSLTACGGGDSSVPPLSTPDTSTPDTSTPDTSTPDTSTPDTSTSTPDTSTPDTSTSTPDTSTPDTSTPVVTNLSPTVNAGLDQTVDENTIVDLSTSAVDSDGIISAYLWVQTSGDDVTITGNTAANASFTSPTLIVESTFSFEVTVTDNEGATTKDEVSVIVQPVNISPTVDVGIDNAVNEKTDVTIVSTVSDPDGSIVSYQWKQVSGTSAELTTTTTQNLTFTTPILSSQDVLEFQLSVSDNEGGIATDSVLITVIPVPFIVTLNGPTTDISVGEQIVITSTSDIDISSYSWSHDTTGTSIFTTQQISADQSSISFTAPTLEGDSIELKLVVTDAYGDTAQESFVVNITKKLFDQGSVIANLNQTDVNLVADGDVDGDGDLDFIIAQGSQLKLYLNANGTWASTYIADITKFTNFLYGLELALIDGDEFLDIVVSDGQESTYWYKNNGDGSFMGTANSISSYFEGKFIVTDLDNDNDNDIVIMNAGINFVSGVAKSVLSHQINNGSGGFSGGTNNRVPYSIKLASGILDNDSLLDYVFYEGNNDRISWYSFNGMTSDLGEMTFQANLLDDDNIKDIKVVDLNNDSINDIIFSTQASGENGYIKVFLANTYGEFATEVTVIELVDGISLFELADFNNDGNLDIVAQVSSNRNFYLYLNDNGSFSGRQAIDSSDYTPHLKIKDYDNDGTVDIRLVKDGNVIIYKNQF